MDAGIVLAIALIVRSVVCCRLHHINSDEFFYTVIARDVYRIWIHQLQTTVHAMDTLHPGGVPMVLAVVFLITGKPLIVVGQHFNVVLSCFIVASTYWMVREAVGNRWIAVTAAVLMAFVPAAVRDADRAYADNQATLLVTIAMAAAFRSWRTGRILPWILACVALGAAFLTKEYLLVLSAPALAIGSLMNVRRHRWTYLPTLLLILAVALVGIWFLQFKSMLLPQASYLLNEIHGERQDYVGRSAPSLHKLMAQHLSEGDIPYVFLALAVLGFIVLLLSLRKPVSVAPEGATNSNPGAVVAMILLPLTFCLFFSMFRNLWGARLVFPSFPAICAASATGLLATGSIPGLIGLLGVEVLTFYWLRTRTGLWPHYLQAVYGIPLIALAFHTVRLLLPRMKQVANLRRGFSYAGLGILLLALAAPGISRIRFDLKVQAAKYIPNGPQFGMFKAADWIKANIKPDDHVLACNPRQMAYLQQSTYAHLVRSAWWDSATKYAEPARLAKLKVKWVLINLPETKQYRANQLYQDFKRRTDMREAYSLFNKGGVVLAFFEVLPHPPPSNSP